MKSITHDVLMVQNNTTNARQRRNNKDTGNGKETMHKCVALFVYSVISVWVGDYLGFVN